MVKKSEQLSNVDAAWWAMEDPTNLMMVTGVLALDSPIDMAYLKAVLEHRWLKFDRFRQRLVESRLPLTLPSWETDPHFDINSHIRKIALPAPGDHKALQDLASDLMSTPLDYSKPLWQLHVIEKYGEGSAILIRTHHAIADGMALVYVLLAMTDMYPGAPMPEAPEIPVEEEASTSKKKGFLQSAMGTLFHQATSAADLALKVSGKIVKESYTALSDSEHALELLNKGTDGAMSAGRLVLRTPDPITPFKGDLGVSKRAAWSRPLPLKSIKAIKNATGTTVNDVLVSAMTGGLRHYLLEKGEDVEGLNFRAAVPVNLRKESEMGQLGNKFGLVFLSLPVGIEDPLARLAEVHKRMDELKGSSEAIVSLGILNAIGFSPTELRNNLLKLFASKATCVMTNVPGPPIPLYFAGSKINSLMFWVPQSGRLGLGISILSYAGDVMMGVASDAGLIPDPDNIVEGFYAEYDRLVTAVNA